MSEFQYVKSSNLRGVAYDNEKRELAVEFTNGNIYTYMEVPQDDYDGLLSAASPGTYFASHIKNNYAFRRGR